MSQFVSPLRFIPVGCSHAAQVRAAMHAAAVQRLPGVSLNSQYIDYLVAQYYFFSPFKLLIFIHERLLCQTDGPPLSISNIPVLKSKSSPQHSFLNIQFTWSPSYTSRQRCPCQKCVLLQGEPDDTQVCFCNPVYWNALSQGFASLNTAGYQETPSLLNKSLFSVGSNLKFL